MKRPGCRGNTCRAWLRPGSANVFFAHPLRQPHNVVRFEARSPQFPQPCARQQFAVSQLCKQLRHTDQSLDIRIGSLFVSECLNDRHQRVLGDRKLRLQEAQDFQNECPILGLYLLLMSQNNYPNRTSTGTPEPSRGPASPYVQAHHAKCRDQLPSSDTITQRHGRVQRHGHADTRTHTHTQQTHQQESSVHTGPADLTTRLHPAARLPHARQKGGRASPRQKLNCASAAGMVTVDGLRLDTHTRPQSRTVARRWTMLCLTTRLAVALGIADTSARHARLECHTWTA